MAENALSIFQCSFRKKYSTEHVPIAMIQKARNVLDKDGTFGALLRDLSKLYNMQLRGALLGPSSIYKKKTTLKKIP